VIETQCDGISLSREAIINVGIPTMLYEQSKVRLACCWMMKVISEMSVLSLDVIWKRHQHSSARDGDCPCPKYDIRGHLDFFCLYFTAYFLMNVNPFCANFLFLKAHQNRQEKRDFHGHQPRFEKRIHNKDGKNY
jgi:hypothetical protein